MEFLECNKWPISEKTPYLVYRPYSCILGKREKSLGWYANMTEIARMDELKEELEELRALVNTLLTIIMEEADGIQSGSAKPITALPSLGYSM